MHPDVQSLLAVQVDDLHVYELEDRLASLAPRLAALEKEHGKVKGQLDRARAGVEAEEHHHREALIKVETHRALVDRSQRAYESVTSPKEANAAITQLEQTKRMQDDSLREAAQFQGRVNEQRHQVADLEVALAAVEARQEETRAQLDTERQAIVAELEAAKAKRDAKANSVPRSMLTIYDKVRVRKRAVIVYSLRGPSCSSCDTAIPTQRRAAMAATGSLEMCEGCGVLLYAGD